MLVYCRTPSVSTSLTENSISLTGVNTPRKFRATLRYLRQMLVGSSPHSPLSGHEESGDERDSGVRTGSEPTSPLTSEWENDHVHFNASNFSAQLPSHVSTFAGGLQHRFVYSQVKMNVIILISGCYTFSVILLGIF